MAASAAVLATKLYIPPPPPKAVVRTRLRDRMERALSAGSKLTLISAPAGFGKTTLVTEWIASGGRPAAWLSLDERDNNVARFLIYIISALQEISPNLGEGLLDVIRASQPLPMESILTELLNQIAAIPDDFILVLDDYHLTDARTIDETLTFIVEHLPAQMHLVITTREDPALPIPRLRARNRLMELRAADLRFTPSEAAEFLNQVMDLGLSADDVAALESRTEGWIAGLQLAALSMKGNKDVTGFIQAFAGDHRYIVDYLVEEVLRRQSEDIRSFLLQTSILERLNGSLCDAVIENHPEGTSQPRSKARLESLQRGNLFLIPLDDKREWYRYHHLFADVLRMHLMTEQPDRIDSLHRRASEWFEKNGSANDAVRHALAARDFSRTAGLAETTWQKMHDSFQSATWLGWVKELPEELIRTRPVLCTQIAWALMDAHEVDASESRLRDAERRLEGSSDEMVIVEKEQFRSLRARIAFARAYNAQTRRDIVSAIKYAELVLELIPEENQSLRSQASAILGATYLINGDLDAACRSMDEWIANSLKVGNYFSAFAYAMVEKADILAAQGHLREALRTYQQALQLASKHDSRVLRVMAHPYLGMSVLYHEMGDDKAAEQHFQKSHELASLHRSVDWAYRECIAQARLNESAGDLDAAIDLLEEGKSFYIKTLMPHTRPLDAIKARIYLKQGQLSKAEEWVNKQGLSVDDELIYFREFEHIVLARVLLAQYQNNRDEHVILQSLNLLERLLKAAEDKKRLGSMLQILVTQALAYQAKGDTSSAQASLERALTLAQPEGYFRIFVDEGEPVRLLLLDLRRFIEKKSRGNNHELLGYVDKLVSAFTQPKAVQQSKLIEPLSQRELEILRLLRTELSVPEIARELVVAVSTVRSHTKSIYSKLGVNNRRTAVNRAAELNLI
ncbi:MAG TPA: LuxR C-terminal-related transcriptional regulator [Anaerolineales bacterium]|nr:LuxR C-terminal-related transcriptional regulator [Anaerolineales bacterium]